MWESLGNVLKIFLEKHIYPTVIAVVAAIVTILFLPENNIAILKIGKIGVGVLSFCLAFLLVELLIWCYIIIKKRLDNKKNQAYLEETSQFLELQNLEKIWRQVDRMTPEDKELLMGFIKTNNTPIERSSATYYAQGSLLSSDWVVSSVKNSYEEPVIVPEDKIGKIIPVRLSETVTVTQYKLKQSYFELLKYSLEKYGKISNFDTNIGGTIE